MGVLANPKHEAFAQFYALDPETKGNGAASYVKAGYSATGANVSASRLANSPNVASRIKEIQTRNAEAVIGAQVKMNVRERESRVRIAERIIARLLKAVDKELTPGDMPVVKEAREWLRHTATDLGQWTEKQEHTVVQPSADLGHLPPEALTELLQRQQAVLADFSARFPKPAQLPAGPDPTVIDAEFEDVPDTPRESG